MSKVQSFSEFLSVLLKTIASRHGSARLMLKENPQVLHRVFYEVESAYRRHFPQLKELHFITAGAYPYSPELTEALDALQMSGAIARENPSFEKFSPTRYGDTDRVLSTRRRALTGSDPRREKAFDGLVQYLDRELSAPA